MSGGPHHNPHGRQGQPAPGWNHLQVPNYFPRQPQIAHMSSDRPLSHSPLTWHTPTPPEHQQVLMKGAPNLFRHTPTPPDVQALKPGAPNSMFRHTPTPPDRDTLKSYRHTPTPPDPTQAMATAIKGNAAMYRLTPTPPDPVSHSMKPGVSLYRRTPPLPVSQQDCHKGAPSPLFNLQQMISDSRNAQAQRTSESLRDNLMARTEGMGYPRHSPGPTTGSMDLSVARSPRNGNQNGETSLPVGLSIRDATKINSLDSAEITKIHRVPINYTGKSADFSVDSVGRDGPESPKTAARRPVKKVDAILERLNNAGDNPVGHSRSPHSVIVSAHSLEDSNGSSRGSSSSVNITPAGGAHPYPVCEPANTARASPPPFPLADLTLAPRNPPISIADVDRAASPRKPPTPPEAPSVIMGNTKPLERDPALTPGDCSNEDSSNSNGSSGDSRSKRRRKQLKTSRVENDIACGDPMFRNDLYSSSDRIAPPPPPENRSNDDISRVSILPMEPAVVPLTPSFESDIRPVTENGTLPAERRSDSEDDSAPAVSKTRRKTCSESETVDNIAAMIASADPAAVFPVPPESIANGANISPVPPETAESLKRVLGDPDVESYTPVDTGDGPQRKKRNTGTTEATCDNPTSTQSEDPLRDKGKVEVESSSFVRVENELEKMFAGIEEEGGDRSLDPVTGLMTDRNGDDSKISVAEKPQGKKKRAPRRASAGAPSGDEGGPKRKRKITKKSNAAEETGEGTEPERIKDPLGRDGTTAKGERAKIDDVTSKDADDSGGDTGSTKSRGPYVQIRGPRDSPLSVSVINAPVHEEDADRSLQRAKGPKAKSSLNSDGDFRNKVKSKGLHGSTLSVKYDAVTADASWICVFCKRGPHTGGTAGRPPQGGARNMGDLFGPYVVTSDCADFREAVKDPRDTELQSSGRPGGLARHRQVRGHPKRLKTEPEAVDGEKVSFPNEEMYAGMTEAGDGTYEVWLHEDCAVWAPGLLLVGAKIVGLEGAVWGCCTVRCKRCLALGASIGCLKRGCSETMHVNCARAELWHLSSEDFTVHCKEHSPRS